MSKKINKKEKYNDSWMYILLLSTFVILTESVKTYSFYLKDIKLSYTVFLIPITFAITNYITKKYGIIKSLLSLIISLISLVFFVAIMSFTVGKPLNLEILCSGLIGYIISQVINIFIYKFLLVNTSSPFRLVYLNYIFANIVFYMTKTISNMSVVINDGYWKTYIASIVIQAVLCIFITMLDVKIKAGIGNDD